MKVNGIKIVSAVRENLEIHFWVVKINLLEFDTDSLKFDTDSLKFDTDSAKSDMISIENRCFILFFIWY